MTTSRLPFEANTIGELCQKITKASYTPPSVMNQSVPKEIQNIIQKCLKKNPSDRYQSARELLQDVTSAAAGISIPPTRLASPGLPTAPTYREPTSSGLHQSNPATQAVPKSKSSIPLVSTVVGVILLVAAAAAYFIMSGNPASTSASKSPQQPSIQAPTQKQSVSQGVEMYTVDCAEGRATVYSNGDQVGFTPHRFPAKSGEQFEFVLKLDGYQDKAVRLTTSENKKTYTFMMEKKN
jgi:serine/threonine-protein kinase